MTENQKLVLDLVKLGIGYTESIAISHDVKWEKVFSFAQHHGLTAIALDGAQKSFDNGQPVELDPITKLQWIGEVHQMEAIYKQHWDIASRLAKFYSKHGIKMLLLKGLGLSLNYPKPEHRPCGDLDIYLFGDIGQGDNLVSKELGISIDNSHHIHTVFNLEGLTVENHYNFFNVYAHPSSKQVDQWMKKVAENSKETDGILFPSVEMNSLYIIRHAATHFAAESITLRHVLDWAFFVDKYNQDIDWEWFWGRCKELNMERFVLAINELCVKYLGFSADKFKTGAGVNLTERVFEEILQPEFDEKNPIGGGYHTLNPEVNAGGLIDGSTR